MTKMYTLEYLTDSSVSVVIHRTVEVEGETMALPPHACSYTNTQGSREQLINDLPEPYLSAVLTVWGDEVIPYTETVYEEPTESE